MRRYDRFNQRYAFVMLIWMTAFLATSWLLPQNFHAATIPLAMAALVRLVWNWNIRKKKQPDLPLLYYSKIGTGIFLS